MTVNINPKAVSEAIDRQSCHGMTKTWEDVARYAVLIEQMRPEVIVECGTFNGSSALWFAQFAPVITVDVDHSKIEGLKDRYPGRIEWVTGSSIDPAVVERVHGLVAGRRALVSLDSDHSRDHVYAELRAYSPLTRAGDWLVCEDGLHLAEHGTGPLAAIERFLLEEPGWFVDSKLEALHPVTMFPSGWLRRVR